MSRRVLVLLPSVPVPPDAGAKLRNRGLLRELGSQAGYEVDAIAFGRLAEQQRLGALVRRAHVVPTPRHRGPANRLRDLLATPWPDMARRLWSPVFAEAVGSALAAERYDLVQAEGIEMAPFLAGVPPERRVYDAHNPEFLLQRRASQTAPGQLVRLYSRLQWRRLERFERAVVRSTRLVLAVSEHDANQLLALADPSTPRVRVVPNAIDVADFAYAPPAVEASPNLLLLGALDFRPNAEAARWLLNAVLPRLGPPGPSVRLWCVGRRPPRWLVRAGQHDDRVAVTGYVRDERPYLARAMALLLPLRAGGGTRLKALVAMASGVPIVSTRLGMEGLEAVPGEHYLAAETADEWVAALGRVVEDAAERQRLAASARRLVEREYDWRVVGRRLRAAYAELFG